MKKLLSLLLLSVPLFAQNSSINGVGAQNVTASHAYVAGGGSANAQTATYSPAVTSLVAGLQVCWLPTAANTTTTPTFAPNGLTAKTITKTGTAALAASDLTTTAVACVIYDGTEWQLQNPQTASGGGGGGGAWTNITSTVTLSGACVLSGNSAVVSTPGTNCTMSSIPGTYTALRVMITAATSAAATFDDVLMQFNADTGAHYNWQLMAGTGSSVVATSAANAVSLDIGGFASANSTSIAGVADVLISNYAGTTFFKVYGDINSRPSNTTGTGWEIFQWGGNWTSTSAITSIKIFPSVGPNFVAGSTFTIYGIS